MNEQLKSISIFVYVRRIVHIISKCEHRILIFQSRQNSSKCQSNKTWSFCIDKNNFCCWCKRIIKFFSILSILLKCDAIDHLLETLIKITAMCFGCSWNQKISILFCKYINNTLIHMRMMFAKNYVHYADVWVCVYLVIGERYHHHSK